MVGDYVGAMKKGIAYTLLATSLITVGFMGGRIYERECGLIRDDPRVAKQYKRKAQSAFTLDLISYKVM
tara:strand:+ start:463 stop:669 length:207 start_codon:yes stop_codon:yes gene_type:complete